MIPTPHNVTTGWHSASQPAPLVYSLSDGVEKHTFAIKTQQGGKPNKKPSNRIVAADLSIAVPSKRFSYSWI